jgi:hypothetical protein
MVQAEVVEAQEFPHLSQAHQVRAVPKTIINGVSEVLGAVNERMLLQKVLSVVGQEDLLEEMGKPTGVDAGSGPTSIFGR